MILSCIWEDKNIDNSPGHGEITWSNGNHYFGSVRGILMHGEGTFTWVKGDYFKGNWHLGHKTGRGAMCKPLLGCTTEIRMGEWNTDKGEFIEDGNSLVVKNEDVESWYEDYKNCHAKLEREAIEKEEERKRRAARLQRENDLIECKLNNCRKMFMDDKYPQMGIN